MSDRERDIGKKVAEAITKLPNDKQQYFLGYAEAIADMTESAADAGEAQPA